MKKMLRYFRLCLKRIAKDFPTIFTVSLVMFASIFLIAALTLKSYTKAKKMEVGVVDKSKETYVNMGLLALDKIDSIKFSITFIKMDEETAKEKLKRDEIVGYVVIPETYIHDIYDGTNTPAVYVTKQSSSGFNSAIADKLSGAVSDMVTNSQALIYAAWDIDSELGRSYSTKLENNRKINAVFLESILERDKTFEEQVLGIADSVSITGYYICGMLALFTFLLGIAFCRVLYKQDYAIYRVLKCNRVGVVKQVLSEYVAFALFVFITIALFTVMEFKAFISVKDISVPDLKYFDTELTVHFILQLIPAIMAISAFQLMLYESSNGIISSVILQFVTVTLFAYLSGFFYASNKPHGNG